jgi:hypothetical protein
MFASSRIVQIQRAPPKPDIRGAAFFSSFAGYAAMKRQHAA